jgi:integrase
MRRGLKAGAKWQDDDLVFPNTVGKPINAGNFYRRNFQPLLKRAALEGEGFTIHSLRHKFATTLAAKNVNPSTAQKLLGHSDVRMTLAIYTRHRWYAGRGYRHDLRGVFLSL